MALIKNFVTTDLLNFQRNIRATIYLTLKFLFIILLFNSCDNANNKAAESKMITENPTIPPSCEGNACSVTVWRWDKITGKHVFKNIDENRTIIRFYDVLCG